jgi:hypothetical protein
VSGLSFLTSAAKLHATNTPIKTLHLGDYTEEGNVADISVCFPTAGQGTRYPGE